MHTFNFILYAMYAMHVQNSEMEKDRLYVKQPTYFE